ncbi:hypothetical protein ABPG75_003453 [Micractinium tetrahymenae]
MAPPQQAVIGTPRGAPSSSQGPDEFDVPTPTASAAAAAGTDATAFGSSSLLHAPLQQPQGPPVAAVGPTVVVQQALAQLATLSAALDYFSAQGQGRIMTGLLHYAATLREQLARAQGATPAAPSTPPPDLAQRRAAQRNMSDVRRCVSHLEQLLSSLPAALDAEAAEHEAAKGTLRQEMWLAKSRAGQAHKVAMQRRPAAAVEDSLERANKRIRTMEDSLERKRSQLESAEKEQARLQAALDEAAEEIKRLKAD